MASIDIEEVSVALVPDIAAISCAFRVERICDVIGNDDGGFDLVERTIATPYIKDYDGIAGNRPGSWVERFDLSHWGLLLARADEQNVGSALIAFDAADLDMLEGRHDLAVIWDLRVLATAREQGIGTRLIATAESWAKQHGCNEIRVETQNINLAACRCYARAGFRLIRANEDAYPEHPDETQLIWTKRLERGEA
ncbi:GNAT family N-acetyltransferase [Sphingobium nicotianae]|uniref:GNAT family N-acetyltransferase n=1 Tax=Sphingobium nicotianae TaxID=2782607 RepID=A0A9X1IT90_9SPHN|nr:GNAT family N-acetyltransferase [Sphingobium nicotianae]MBT2189358.1 GNAT family N-acetyltransferase [Sphingobium nicotianae]